jgi:PKD repeat protein
LFANINNSSEGSNAGFEDFTCIGFANVIQGVSYNISVTTLSEESVRVWIDFNNSGSFETEEMMMNSGNGYSHSTEFEIPQECVFNIGLRMRVGSDYYNLPEPCVDPYYGQHEDYTLIIQSNTLPPVASINHDIIDECNGIVQFTDGSGNIPTSWLWEFGDGGTSADQNPLHIYTTAGVYTVTLTASNIFGTDIATKGILVNSLYPEMEITGDFLEDEPMYFSNNTPGAISWLWNFGDGYASSLQNPEHIYADHGIYQVILMVTNGVLCQKSIFETIEIDEVIGINSLSNGGLIVYPNPSNGKFIIQSSQPTSEINVTVMSISGTKVYQGKICGNGKAIKEDLNLQHLDQGIYLLKLYDNKNITVHKLIIE